tara:strand:+ start:272 stop:427 length:156 start_codon:yes stop_codon:yes gene_type:complete
VSNQIDQLISHYTSLDDDGRAEFDEKFAAILREEIDDAKLERIQKVLRDEG